MKDRDAVLDSSRVPPTWRSPSLVSHSGDPQCRPACGFQTLRPWPSPRNSCPLDAGDQEDDRVGATGLDRVLHGSGDGGHRGRRDAAGGGDSDAATAPPLALVLAGVAALGAGMGLVLGGAQWLVLRHAAFRAPWVRANVLAWAAAMPWIFLAASLSPAGSPPLAAALLGAGGGAAAGGTLGVLTLWAVRRLRPSARAEVANVIGF